MSYLGVIKRAMDIEQKLEPAAKAAFGYLSSSSRGSRSTKGASGVASRKSASAIARNANRYAKKNSGKGGGGVVKTTPIPTLSVMSSNPVMHIAWHPMCPFPPVMTTCLTQTHQTFLRNDLSLVSSPGVPPAASAIANPNYVIPGKTGIDVLGVRTNDPLNPFGNYASGDFEGKHMPWHNWLMTNVYKNCVVYASAIHFQLEDDYNAAGWTATSRPTTVAVLKLHSDVQHNGEYWQTPKKWDGSAFTSTGAGSLFLGSSATGDHSGRRGYSGQIDNLSNWMMDGKGDFFERAKFFEDQFMLHEMHADDGRKFAKATLSGHWDLKAHENIDWKDIVFKPHEFDDGVVTSFAFGDDLTGPQTVALGQNQCTSHPVWYLFQDLLDNNEKFPYRVNVRAHLEYKVAYFNLRSPFSEGTIDELDYTT